MSKIRNRYAVPAQFRRNAGAHTHKNPPRQKFTINDFHDELEEEMTCYTCSYYDIVDGVCELHEINNLTGDHTCKDHDNVEEIMEYEDEECS